MLRFQLAIGAVLSAGAWLVPLPGPEAAAIAGRFLVLAAGVWVPLALCLLAQGQLIRWARLLATPATAFLLISLALEPGVVALVFAGPWGLIIALLGLRGVHLLIARPTTAPDWCVTLGFLALPTAGAWLVASRLGQALMGFNEPFLILTAVHFHYAGLLVPVILGTAGRFLSPETATARAYRVLGPAACLGVWLVALGITLGGPAEAALGLLFEVILLAVAVVLASIAGQLGPWADWLLRLAVASAFVGLALAAAYSLGRLGLPAPDINLMARAHGAVQSLGFVGLGLIAVAIAHHRRETP
jgi:hypothetical protein